MSIATEGSAPVSAENSQFASPEQRETLNAIIANANRIQQLLRDGLGDDVSQAIDRFHRRAGQMSAKAQHLRVAPSNSTFPDQNERDHAFYDLGTAAWQISQLNPETTPMETIRTNLRNAMEMLGMTEFQINGHGRKPSQTLVFTLQGSGWPQLRTSGFEGLIKANSLLGEIFRGGIELGAYERPVPPKDPNGHGSPAGPG